MYLKDNQFLKIRLGQAGVRHDYYKSGEPLFVTFQLQELVKSPIPGRAHRGPTIFHSYHTLDRLQLDKVPRSQRAFMIFMVLGDMQRKLDRDIWRAYNE